MKEKKDISRMTNLITSLKKSELGFFLLAVVLNSLLIFFLYKSVFSLEIQGDTWQYAYNQEFAYGNSLLTPDSIRSLKTSLGGSFLIFSLIKLTFGLNSFAYYTISVILKFLAAISAYLFIKKLTQNKVSALIASLFLSATFVGIEATHWVFNMYAYVGLIFIILGLSVSLELPQKFSVKRWLVSFLLVAIGIWVGPMRTNGIILVVLAWGLYKVFLLRSADSYKNFFYWLGGFIVLYLVYRNYLGLFEPAYSKYYIWDAWWRTFGENLSIGKYDFLFSPASNVGRILLPDIWLASINFYQKFSPIFGLTNFRAILVPMFLIFILLSFILSGIGEEKNRIFQQMFVLGFFWSALVTFVYKQGPLNFPSWQDLIFTLWGGYFWAWCIAFFSFSKKEGFLRDAFLFAFFWSFVFMLVPIATNGGNTFSTFHRYFVVTAQAVPLFVGGILSLVFQGRINFSRALVLLGLFTTISLHVGYTKSFFDNKAKVHSRIVSQRIWDDFVNIVPNKPEYKKNNPKIWFEAKTSLDKEALFESLFFGGAFRIGMKYGWDAANINGFYFENYNTLISDVRKRPDILDDFYAIGVEDRRLINITDRVKKDILAKI